MVQIFNGRFIQEKLLKDIKARAEGLSGRPKLVILSSGASPESLLYINKKTSFGETVGCSVEHRRVDPSISVKELRGLVDGVNSESSVDGLMFQIPFVSPLSVSETLDLIDPGKDVDGLTAFNMGRLFRGDEAVIPATTRGILEMLSHYEISVAGKRVVVIGRSALVGRPTALALLNRSATVTVCHSGTRDLSSEVRLADIVISAVGDPGMITPDMTHSEQVLIDVGTSLGEDGKLRGDIEFQTVSETVKAVSPVPGGVGPLTVASLFLNLIDLAELRRS